MANETFGHMVCPLCDERGELRRYKNHKRGFMYMVCGCGHLRPSLNQSVLLRKGEFVDGHPLSPDPGDIAAAHAAYDTRKNAAAPKPEEVKKPDPAPAPEPKPVPKAKPTPTRQPEKKPEPVKPKSDEWGGLL